MVELRLGGRNAGRRKGLLFLFRGENIVGILFREYDNDDDDEEYNF